MIRPTDTSFPTFTFDADEPQWLVDWLYDNREPLYADTLIGRPGGKAMGELDPTPVADLVADPLRYGLTPGEWVRLKSTPCPFAPGGSQRISRKGGDIKVLVDGGRLHVLCSCEDHDHSPVRRTKGGKGDNWLFTYDSPVTEPDPMDVGDDGHRVTVELDASGKLSYRSVIDAIQQAGSPKVMVLRADTGQGKTHFASEVAAKFRAKGLRVVAASPTRSLARSLSNRLGLDCYLDSDTADGGSYWLPGSVAFCAPSIQRSVTYETDADGTLAESSVDLLVLDEVEQALRMLASGPTDAITSSRAWHALVTQVRSAHGVLCLDAHAGALTKYLFREAGFSPEDVVWIDTDRNAPRDVVVYPSRASVIDASVQHYTDGGRPAVLVHSVAEAETLGRMFRDRGGHPCVLTSDTVQDFDLGTINQWINDYDALVYTPVIGTGVSVDVPRFTRLFGVVRNRQGTADDLQQQLDRVRSLMASEVHLWAEGGVSPEPWERDAGSVWARFKSKLMAADKACRMEAGAISARDRADDTSFNRLVCEAHAAEVFRGRGWAVRRFMDEQGHRGGRLVEYVPVDQARLNGVAKERKAVRDAVQHDAREEVIDADAADEDTAKAVKRRGARSREERVAVQRRGVERFYGDQTPVDHDLLKFDRKGRGREACRSLAHTMAVLVGDTAAERVRDLDRREVDLQISTTKLRHNTSRAAGLATILRRLGLADPLLQWARQGCHAGFLETKETPTCVTASSPSPGHNHAADVDPDVVRDVAEWAVQHKTALAALGITVPRNLLDEPMRLVTAVLGKLGVKLRSKQHRVNGARTRSYWIEKADFDTVWSYASAYHERLHTGILVTVHEDEADEFEVHLARQSRNTEAALLALDAMLAA